MTELATMWQDMLTSGDFTQLGTAVFAGLVGALFFAVLFLRLLLWVFGWFGLRT